MYVLRMMHYVKKVQCISYSNGLILITRTCSFLSFGNKYQSEGLNSKQDDLNYIEITLKTGVSVKNYFFFEGPENNVE